MGSCGTAASGAAAGEGERGERCSTSRGLGVEPAKAGAQATLWCKLRVLLSSPAVLIFFVQVCRASDCKHWPDGLTSWPCMSKQ